MKKSDPKSSPKPHHSPGFVKVAEDARKNIREINADDLQKKMSSDGQLKLVDVREDHEWIQGHIPGAQHLGRGILERDIEVRIPRFDCEIVLYCGGGFRSALAAQSLQQMGYTRVFSLAGGYRNWCERQLPIQKD